MHVRTDYCCKRCAGSGDDVEVGPRPPEDLSNSESDDEDGDSDDDDGTDPYRLPVTHEVALEGACMAPT